MPGLLLSFKHSREPSIPMFYIVMLVCVENLFSCQVEDHGLSSSFFPFIVAEQEVCREIRVLEEAIEVVEAADDIHKNAEGIEAKNQALDFIHEMGWLLHRSHLKFRLGHLYRNSDLFPFGRCKWLIEFSINHDWCAVVKKLLVILFEGTVDTGDHSSIELALLDMNLLHQAVRRNCRPMVELLLKFVPDKPFGRQGAEQKQGVNGKTNYFIFKPDVVGPAGLTPLHVAASKDGSENVLDALTDDPGLVSTCLCVTWQFFLCILVYLHLIFFPSLFCSANINVFPPGGN